MMKFLLVIIVLLIPAKLTYSYHCAVWSHEVANLLLQSEDRQEQKFENEKEKPDHGYNLSLASAMALVFFLIFAPLPNIFYVRGSVLFLHH